MTVRSLRPSWASIIFWDPHYVSILQTPGAYPKVYKGSYIPQNYQNWT